MPVRTGGRAREDRRACPWRSGGAVRLCTNPWHAGHLVVDERRHVELEHLRVLGDDVGRRAVLLVALQLVVRLDDVRQFVGQVVLQTATFWVRSSRIDQLTSCRRSSAICRRDTHELTPCIMIS